MTEEMKKKLEAAHAEEKADYSKYIAMAEELGDTREAGILCDIAHDEYTHIHLIEHILEMEE